MRDTRQSTGIGRRHLLSTLYSERDSAVQTLPRFIRLSLLLMVFLLPSFAVQAQEADADLAVARLKQGVAQYKALNFSAAKATLLQVDRGALPEKDQAILDRYLVAVPEAFRRQSEAMDAYNEAVEALGESDLVQARMGFQLAAMSEYLPAPVRQDARAQLALVVAKAEAAVAAAPPAPRLAAPPVAVPRPRPEASQLARAIEEPPVRTAQPAVTGSQAEVEARKALADQLARRARISQTLSRARQAMAENRPDEAALWFKQVLALDPQNAEARQALAQLAPAPILEVPADPGVVSVTPLIPTAPVAVVSESGALTALQQRRQIQRQRADVEYDKALKRSFDSLIRAQTAEDFEASANALHVAENIVESNKNLYIPSEYRDRLVEISELLNGVELRREEWERAEVARQLTELSKAEADRVQRAQEQLERTVGRLTANARTLMAARKYRDALQVLDQITKLDPANTWASDQKGLLEQLVLLQDQQEIQDSLIYEENRSLGDIREAQIPWYEMLRFPRNWREIRELREGQGLQAGFGSEEDRRIRQVLAESVIPDPIGWEDLPLVEAIEYLRTVMNLNIHPNWKWLEVAGYTKETATISSVYIVKVSYAKALQVILEDVSGPRLGTEDELSYVVDGGVITITTQKDLSRKVFPRVYDIRDLVRPGISGGIITTTTGDGDGPAADLGSGGEAISAIVGQIIALITNTIDPISWQPPGETGGLGGDGRIDAWNDQLVVTQTAANHQAIVDLIEQLREKKEIQVAIEARFINVNSAFLESIGVDLDFYFNLGSRLGSGMTTDPWTGATVPTRTGTSGWGTDRPGSDSFTPISGRQGSAGFTNLLGATTPTGGGFNLSEPALSIAGTFLDDIQVDFLIEATQAHKTTRVLSAPRLTLLSGTTAQIHVGRELTYIADVDIESDVTDNVVTRTIDFDSDTLQLGTSMVITATVSSDLKYVTLTISPSITRLLALEFFPFDPGPLLAGGALPMGFEDIAFVQLPDTSVETLTTTVAVPDGGTLLLGGLKVASEIEREMGVPILSKIPFINRGFTNRGKMTDETTLLVLVKPTIIIPREQERREFP